MIKNTIQYSIFFFKTAFSYDKYPFASVLIERVMTNVNVFQNYFRFFSENFFYCLYYCHKNFIICHKNPAHLTK